MIAPFSFSISTNATFITARNPLIAYLHTSTSATDASKQPCTPPVREYTNCFHMARFFAMKISGTKVTTNFCLKLFSMKKDKMRPESLSKRLQPLQSMFYFLLIIEIHMHRIGKILKLFQLLHRYISGRCIQYSRNSVDNLLRMYALPSPVSLHRTWYPARR